MKKAKSKEKKQDKNQNNDQQVEEIVNDQEESKAANTAEMNIEESEISEIDKLKDELAEAKDKYLRLYSEFENFRRRTSKEKLDLIQTANEGLISSLIPVIDDFERAEKSFEEEKEIKGLKEGVKLIANKFKNTLENKGLKVMESEQGTEFDPELHEAITQIPAPSEKLKGKVVDVIEKGYFLGEKVVRFAKVVTGN